MMALPPRWRQALWAGLLAVVVWQALAGDARDIVFDCPCRAEWTAGEPGGAGELALTFGVRNLRATESGEVRLNEFDLERRTSYVPDTQAESVAPSVGPIPAMAVRSHVRRMAFGRPLPGQPIGVDLWERVAETPGSATNAQAWHRHEVLALWPEAGEQGDRIAFVDLLTDTDGDGVGDVNEQLAGTSLTDPASTPGTPTIDVLALYNDGLREALDGYSLHTHPTPDGVDLSAVRRQRHESADADGGGAGGGTRRIGYPRAGRGSGPDGPLRCGPVVSLPRGRHAHGLPCWGGRVRGRRRGRPPRLLAGR